MPLQDEPSLLERYDLRVEQLDYAFVRDCSDRQTLERIIRVLRSGEEGCYPHLLRYTEDRLVLLHPESRLLITDKPATQFRDLPSQQLKALEEELKEWSTGIAEEEEELTRYDVIRAPLPPVRNANDADPLLSASVDSESSQPQLSENDQDSLLALGHQHLRDGNFLQASLQFQKVLASDPTNTKALGGMAAIHDRPKGAAVGGAVVQEIL